MVPLSGMLHLDDSYQLLTGVLVGQDSNTLKATFAVVGNTYALLTTNLWKETKQTHQESGGMIWAGWRTEAFTSLFPEFK